MGHAGFLSSTAILSKELEVRPLRKIWKHWNDPFFGGLVQFRAFWHLKQSRLRDPAALGIWGLGSGV